MHCDGVGTWYVQYWRIPKEMVFKESRGPALSPWPSDRAHSFVLHPISSSPIYLRPVASCSFSFLSSTPLLRLLPVQIAREAALLSPSCIAFVELCMHDISFSCGSHLPSIEVVLLRSNLRVWHSHIAVVCVILRVLTVSGCCSRSD